MDIAKTIAKKFDGTQSRSGYIIGKIRIDPSYNAVYEILKDNDQPLWDGGCGLGLLGCYLRERGWQGRYLGTDTSADKIADGNKIIDQHYKNMQVQEGDIQSPPKDFRGNVVLLDVIHYLDHEDQVAFLQNVQSHITEDGIFMTRFTAKDRSWRYYATVVEDKLIDLSGWIHARRSAFPTTETMRSAFDENEWDVKVVPMWGITPFNSHLLTAKRKKFTS